MPGSQTQYVPLVNRFECTDEFRKEAIFFQKHSKYTLHEKGTPQYREYWERQDYLCRNGMTNSKGIIITGIHYFYLNFIQISMKDKKSGRKRMNFPRFLDIDYDYFHLVDIARRMRKGLIFAKPRRTGFSYKDAALVTHEYNFERDSTSIIGAFHDKLSTTTMNMVLDNTNFLNANTEWRKQRNPDKTDHIKARYEKNIDGSKFWAGYNSQVLKLTFKDNPFASVGKSTSVFIFEEAGTFNNLKDSYEMTEPCWKDGEDMVGLPIIFGCVCAGTKVWTHDGRYINIEDLKQTEGIIGYAGNGIMKEPIVWMKPPAKKPCYKITTKKGISIECSNDHPLLVSNNNRVDNKGDKIVTFKKAEEIKIGEQLMSVRQIPIFGDKQMLIPRLSGLLLGDGYYGNGSAELSIEGDEIYNWLLKEGFSLKIHKEFITKKNTKYRSVTIHGMQDNLKYLGMYGQSKERKQLPLNIHECDMHSISEFIGGYIDADGNINYNKSKNVLSIILTSKYEHLLLGVKQLLYKLNINCAINKQYRKTGYAPGEIYRLYINKKVDILEFKKHIKLLSKHKQETLDSYIPKGKNRYVYNNCKFINNSTNNKGQYYINNNLKLDNLESNYITNIEFIGDKEVYNLNAGITHTYITNSFISGNTGGDMLGGTAHFADMFYNPHTYNLLEFDNVWETSRVGTKCGWFIPATRGRLGGEDNELGTEVMVDDDGNSLEEVAHKSIMKYRERKRKGGDPKAIQGAITQYPLTPSEAFLRSAGAIFSGPELTEWLGKMETTPSLRDNKKKGELYFDNDNKIKFKLNPDLFDIVEYPLRKDSPKAGCVVIWEEPIDTPPWGLYIAGIDPYDQDKADTSDSLGSCIIYKRFYLAGHTYDIPVAEYTGRPELAVDFYENVRKLCIYYNAKALYENQLKGLKVYFEQKNSLHYLYEQPAILKDIVRNSNVNRGYGIHMAESIKDQAEIWVRDWLYQEREDIDGKKILNLHTIRSIPLLKELVAYDREMNTDRVIAFMCCIIQTKEMHRQYISENIPGLLDLDPFFKRKLFTKNKYSRIS